MSAASIRAALRANADEKIAEHSARFFKSGKGEYGEGDRFLGIRVPVIRKQVKHFRNAPERAVLALLRSPYHEERLFGVLLFVDQYKRGDDEKKARICALYLDNRRYVNNWDLVDSSAHFIVGPQLVEGSPEPVYELARSTELWDRRIAMMATYHCIRQNDFKDALKIARILRDDKHDLIHKVVGWMLREIGNRDRQAEERFLKANYKNMPRTMLRYAIEKFPAARRKAYLSGTV
ncbi:MAG: DNA alkylation repair protein [Gammaproteobacteria bacterium]|nr:DNA alkylation repair protein [Gammaproteobacteria bacterium]